MTLLWELGRCWSDTKNSRRGVLDTQKAKSPRLFADVMAEDIGNPLNLRGRHVDAEAHRADDPNKSACDPHGLDAVCVCSLLAIVNNNIRQEPATESKS